MQLVLLCHQIQHARMNGALFLAALETADGVLRNTDKIAEGLLRQPECGAEMLCSGHHAHRLRKTRCACQRILRCLFR